MSKFIALLVVVLMSMSVSVTASVMYTVTDLGSGQANGINASGQVVGTDGAGNAILYSNGSIQDICPGVAYGINNSGQVVGTFGLYSNGSISTSCPSPATAINNNGQAVGYSPHGDGPTYQHAFLYSNGSVQDIGALINNYFSSGGGSSYAEAVNGTGTVVGYYQEHDGPEAAFIYADGSFQSFGGNQTRAYGINNKGEMVGTYPPGGDSILPRQAFLYSGGSFQDLGNGRAYGINDSGDVVGTTGTLAFLYSNGSTQNLDDLIDPTSGWTLQQANAINDSGQIVGYGINSSGQQDAFLLTPVPEPTTLTLLIPSSLLLVRRRR